MLKPKDIIAREDEWLRQRRARLHEQPEDLAPTRFGIALSGGGIRSATINLGVLRTFNLFGLLRQADYLSSVSGGGYTASYVQGTLRQSGRYEALFTEAHLAHLRAWGDYLTPGFGWAKALSRVLLLVTYLSSLLMSWASFIILLFMGYFVYENVLAQVSSDKELFRLRESFLLLWGGWALLGVFVFHFLLSSFYSYSLDLSARFNQAKAALLGLFALGTLGTYLLSIDGFGQGFAPQRLMFSFFLLLVLVLVGFVSNPNALSLHRFYRYQLSKAFLRFAGPWRNAPLHHFAQGQGQADWLAPYPLINTCLNLQAEDDDHFKGTKASDYFLLSPLFCGSKLTGYVETAKHPFFQDMSAPTAYTISAAAVNPGMGIYSNRVLGLLTTLLNLRLGYWVSNPLKQADWWQRLVWWPAYFWYELTMRLGTRNKMVNISDGGHIENMGVYELLRRDCRLIIAVDAGEDPDFMFQDFENLIVRARNELGIAINFRQDHIPEEVLRPRPSHGYSAQRFALADIVRIWEEVEKTDPHTGQVEKFIRYPNKKIGTFVYVKSSVKAPVDKPVIDPEKQAMEYSSYKYKIYHPKFPHESTADQFFDAVQWEAYFQLGKFIAADVLGIPDLNVYDLGETHCPQLSNQQLIDYFDGLGEPLFGNADRQEAELESMLENYSDILEGQMPDEKPLPRSYDGNGDDAALDRPRFKM